MWRSCVNVFIDRFVIVSYKCCSELLYKHQIVRRTDEGGFKFPPMFFNSAKCCSKARSDYKRV